MWQTWLMCLTSLIMYCQAQTGSVICSIHSTFRPAVNTDITATCGTNSIFITILLCPIYYEGYDEFHMALNGRFNDPACHGIADFGADPPVLNFNFSITEDSLTLCGNMLVITDLIGRDELSTVQAVNISGSINSWDTTLSNLQNLVYLFICHFNMQYLLNITEESMSGLSFSVRDSKGSFISMLSMNLFTNQQYTQPLQIPDGGLQLKTRIYVQVKAADLTNRLNVMLERCYATTRPFPMNSTYYDLFVGCARDRQTVVDVNGVSQEARFSFETFSFTEHNETTVSTFYLHCVTRLCESSTCSSMLQNCARKLKRLVQFGQYSSNVETVSSGPIKTRVDNAGSLLSYPNDSVAGVTIVTCLLSICTTGLVVLIIVYRRQK